MVCRVVVLLHLKKILHLVNIPTMNYELCWAHQTLQSVLCSLYPAPCCTRSHECNETAFVSAMQWCVPHLMNASRTQKSKETNKFPNYVVNDYEMKMIMKLPYYYNNDYELSLQSTSSFVIGFNLNILGVNRGWNKTLFSAKH